MKKILFISSSRADYGLIRDIIIQTQKINKDTFLLVTGSHLSSEFGQTIKEIQRDKIKNIIKRKLFKRKLKNFSDLQISGYIADSIKITSKVIKDLSPDIMVILGDRYELLGSAISAMSFRVPIAHIHGGEVTSGADDSSRIQYLNYHIYIFQCMNNTKKD